jgi:monomeric sarcosine oxidase
VAGRRASSPGEADVVVIGGGVVGIATARALAGRDISVALLERGSLTTAQGSSRGTARIIAPAAYPDAAYLEMGLRALEEWRALEQESGTSFLELNGALYAGSAVDGFATTFAAAGVEVEKLAGDEVEHRFGITGLGIDPVLFQPDAGVIRADRAREALLRSATKRGAAMHQHERVVALEVGEDEVEVRTTRRSWHCRRAVVTAGPWTGPMLKEIGIDLPLTVTSQSVAYFRPPPKPEHLPALMEFDGDEPYALIDPHHGLKAALHRRGPETDPSGRWGVIDAEALERIRIWAHSRLPAVAEHPTEVEACLYTNTPDERFIIERHGAIVVGSACSGQGFQFGPQTGAALAELCVASVRRGAG